MRLKSTSHRLSQLEETSINLTPLIDVVFVVLIIFIIIAPMLELDRVELADGSSSKPKEERSSIEASPITIHLHADNTMWISSKQINQQQLLEILKRAKATTPQAVPQLIPDKKAAFGAYQNIKNAAEAAGFEQLDIVLKPG